MGYLIHLGTVGKFGTIGTFGTFRYVWYIYTWYIWEHLVHFVHLIHLEYLEHLLHLVPLIHLVHPGVVKIIRISVHYPYKNKELGPPIKFKQQGLRGPTQHQQILFIGGGGCEWVIHTTPIIGVGEPLNPTSRWTQSIRGGGNPLNPTSTTGILLLKENLFAVFHHCTLYFFIIGGRNPTW